MAASQDAGGPVGPPERVRPWAALQHRDYLLLVTGGFFGGTARTMRVQLNALLLLRLTDSPALLGLMGLFEAVPIVAFGLVGGALADVLNRKKLLVFVQAANIVPPLVMGLIYLMGQPQPWHFYALTTYTAFTMPLEFPARFGMLNRVVPKKHLLNAISTNSMIGQAVFFVGPLLAGATDRMDAVFPNPGTGFAVMYFINAALYVPGILAIASIRVSGAPEGPKRQVSLAAIREGYRFVRAQPMLWSTIMLDFALVVVVFYRYWFPVLSEEVYHTGSLGQGLLNAAAAGGSVLASATFMLVSKVGSSGRLFLLAIFGHALAFIFTGAAPWFWMGMLMAGAMGLTDMITVIMRQDIMQRNTPDRLMGRSASFITTFANVGNALGSIDAGFLAQRIGPRLALMVGGMAGVGVSVAGAVKWPMLWRRPKSLSDN